MNGCEEWDKCGGGSHPFRQVWDRYIEGQGGGDSVWGIRLRC